VLDNAGVGAGKNIEDITLEHLRWVRIANRNSVFLGIQYAIEAMKQSDGDSIINMSSSEAMIGDSSMAAYDSSKEGLGP